MLSSTKTAVKYNAHSLVKPGGRATITIWECGYKEVSKIRHANQSTTNTC